MMRNLVKKVGASLVLLSCLPSLASANVIFISKDKKVSDYSLITTHPECATSVSVEFAANGKSIRYVGPQKSYKSTDLAAREVQERHTVGNAMLNRFMFTGASSVVGLVSGALVGQSKQSEKLLERLLSRRVDIDQAGFLISLVVATGAGYAAYKYYGNNFVTADDKEALVRIYAHLKEAQGKDLILQVEDPLRIIDRLEKSLDSMAK